MIRGSIYGNGVDGVRYRRVISLGYREQAQENNECQRLRVRHKHVFFFLVNSEAVPKVLLFSFVERKMEKEKRSMCTRTMNSAETGTGISEISGPRDWR